MVTQSTEYSLPPTDVRNLIASKITLLDKYIIMNTAENEYTALIYNPNTQNTVQYRVFRSYQSGYNYVWEIQRINDVEFEYQISNEYYVISNDGVGQMMDLPINNTVQSYVSVFLVCVLFFAIIFKGVYFKCLSSKK